MKEIFKSTYSTYFKWSLLLFVITAWFSVGFHHPDEHFQILEFSNYKLGNSPSSELPWEFGAQIRPALQPFISCCFTTIFHTLGIYNPFIIAFTLRLLMAFLSWLIISKLILILVVNFFTDQGRKLFILLSFFLWFIPYINVRFSSENAAAISFLWAIYLLLKPYSTNTNKTLSFFSVGFLLGISFFFRFQMAFAILGLGFWLLFIKKIKWQNWSALIFVASITMAICICIDRWFYGAWVFTPYNYFNVNIIQNVAASFGTDPWWKYFELFIVMVIPPLSLVLFWFLGKGIILKKQHVFTFVLIPFLIGHFIIGHKEMRFLFPMCFIFIFLASIGADYYIQKYNSRKIFRFGYKFLMVFNIIMLTYRTFLPAHETVPYYNFAYINLPKKTTVLCLQVYLFGLSDNLHANFYKPNYINEIIFKTEDDINNYIVNSSQDSFVVYTNSSKLGNVLAKYKHKRIYTLYPEWVLKYNINNWQDRANISCLYTLYKN